MEVKINGVAVSVLTNSLSIDDAIEERSTASFQAKDDTGALAFHKGQQVEIKDDSANIIFAGYVDKPKAQKLPGIDMKIHGISCIDNHYLADKRIIAKAYQNTTAGAIVGDLITSYLADEGVTAGTIQTGATVIEAVFNYIPLTRALESLAEKAGFIWFIDFDKKLYFIDRATLAAPWTATGADIIADSLVIAESAPKYRNKQYIKGGKDISDAMTESQKGDGVKKAFVVALPISTVPTVTVNGVAKTVGIKQVDSGKDFYWSKGSAIVDQDSGGTPLALTDTLAVTYQGEFDIVAISSDQAAISTLQQTEGGATTGIVEEVTDEPSNNSRDAAFQSANAKLEKYASFCDVIQFKTLRYGLQPGQLLTLNIPEHNFINKEVLIQSVRVSDIDGAFLIYDITAVDGALEGSWQNLFKKMATRGEAFVIRSNISEKEILTTLQQFYKTWTDTPEGNIFTTVVCAETLFCSETLYPEFETDKRVTFMELLDASNNVLLRKSITKQTGAATDNIVSTTYIAPYEAIGAIAKVRFYGDATATAVNSSGVMIDEQAYSKAKTSLEALQIDKTDIKGAW